MKDFEKETNSEREYVYTIPANFRSLHPEEKKYDALVSGILTLTLRLVPGARFFVSKRMYGNRLMNFLKNSTLVAERDIRLICGLDLDEKSTFEFKFKPGWQYLTAWDYILPALTGKGTSLTFVYFMLFAKEHCHNIKKQSNLQETE